MLGSGDVPPPLPAGTEPRSPGPSILPETQVAQELSLCEHQRPGGWAAARLPLALLCSLAVWLVAGEMNG